MAKQAGAILASLLFASNAIAQPVPGPAEATGGLSLRLVCMGTGEREVAHSSWASVFTKHGNASGFGVSHSQDQFNEQMDVDLNGSKARARVPRRFLPPLHGGDGGWFDVSEVVVTDDAITGTVLINFANHPKLRIDRRTGSVEMDGKVGAFAGLCKPFKEEERAF